MAVLLAAAAQFQQFLKGQAHLCLPEMQLRVALVGVDANVDAGF